MRFSLLNGKLSSLVAIFLIIHIVTFKDPSHIQFVVAHQAIINILKYRHSIIMPLESLDMRLKLILHFCHLSYAHKYGCKFM
jgi:hypothetical protein